MTGLRSYRRSPAEPRNRTPVCWLSDMLPEFSYKIQIKLLILHPVLVPKKTKYLSNNCIILFTIIHTDKSKHIERMLRFKVKDSDVRKCQNYGRRGAGGKRYFTWKPLRLFFPVIFGDQSKEQKPKRGWASAALEEVSGSWECIAPLKSRISVLSLLILITVSIYKFEHFW